MKKLGIALFLVFLCAVELNATWIAVCSTYSEKDGQKIHESDEILRPDEYKVKVGPEQIGDFLRADQYGRTILSSMTHRFNITAEEALKIVDLFEKKMEDEKTESSPARRIISFSFIQWKGDTALPISVKIGGELVNISKYDGFTKLIDKKYDDMLDDTLLEYEKE